MVGIPSRKDKPKKINRTSKKSPAYLKHKDHYQLYHAIEGGVVDAFKSHPDYLTDKGRHSAVESITKRVIGSIISHTKRVRKDG